MVVLKLATISLSNVFMSVTASFQSAIISKVLLVFSSFELGD